MKDKLTTTALFAAAALLLSLVTNASFDTLMFYIMFFMVIDIYGDGR